MPGVEQAPREDGHSPVPYIARRVIQQLEKMSNLASADTQKRGRSLSEGREKERWVIKHDKHRPQYSLSWRGLLRVVSNP